jgi:iron complex outermembrane recepter protein
MGARSPQPSARIAAAVFEVLRSLSVWAPGAIGFAPLALLQAPHALAQAAAPALSADIPAQPLGDALAAFANQTGLELVYVSGLVHNQKSRSAPAGLRAPEALARLLRGTGLKFEYLTPHSIRILAGSAQPMLTPTRNQQPPEVLVTANRREQSVQDVPITIQVLTGETIERLNVRTFDDFVSYLPGVTAHGIGPAQSNIYMRGLATNGIGIQGSGFNGSFPTVAVYVDEQSVQLSGRNLDVYAADIERIEVLQGPQGTLFGAGAEAGVLRYITNKPKLNVTEGSADGSYATTAHGDPSSALNGVINLPLVPDTLAVRAVIYDERRGGYIDNIPATFARSDTDRSISYVGGAVPPNSVVINNAALVGNNINPVTYQGIRAEALYQFSEDWNALIAQSYQSMDAQGLFTEEAADSLGHPQPPLTVQLFNPSDDRDRFENTSLTVTGRVDGLELLYAGSYLVRNIDQVQDYTNYARGGVYVDYYQCIPPYASNPATAKCFSPSSTWREEERNTHQSHELRITTPADRRLRAVGGLFYESYRIQDQVDWYYLTAIPYFSPIAPPTGYCVLNGRVLNYCPPPEPGLAFEPATVTSINPHVRPPGDAFFNDNTRGYTQQAAYASVDYDLLPRTLTLTAGTRYFDTRATEAGSVVGSFGCSLLNPAAAPVPDPCINRVAYDLDAQNLRRTYTGFKSRATLSWSAHEDALLYYTWSQGFRPGGFNRGFQTAEDSPLYPGSSPQQSLAYKNGGYTAPLAYAPDQLTNNEVGWKTTWFDQRLQWNGAIYLEEWSHAQIEPIDIGGVISEGTINGGNYRVRGLETSVAARVSGGLSIEGGAAWDHSELVKEAPFYWMDGVQINFAALKLPNPAGTLGTPLAAAPPFQGNVRFRYELAVEGYDAFAQVGVVHQAHSFTTTDRLTLDPLGNPVDYNLPPFTTYDASLGVGRDAWVVQLYGQNLTDTRARLYENYRQWYPAITVNRPRTIGLRIHYSFGGSPDRP